MITYPNVSVIEIYRINGWILFITSCGHAHTRPPNWKVKLKDAMICPVCHKYYPDDQFKSNRITETGWVINDVEQEYRENQKSEGDKESHK